ncbi:MAG: CAP domain-containing protein [Hyphomicrobiaceae bacterium]|nr:CAP domain-containing protein [Hyphomicrobiaceae bacterium]
MPTPDIPQVEIAIVELTNAVRKQHSLGEVKPDPELEKAAREYARFLAGSPAFSHTADGRQPADRAKAAGYEPCFISENLSSNLDSRGFETRQLAREAVHGWLNSPGHRKNLLMEHVVDIGVAVAKAPDEQRYVSVQMFGRPYALAYQFRINNASGRTVTYEFLDRAHDIKPRYMTRHTACLPGQITFKLPTAEDGVIARYQARDGDIFVLRRRHSGVKVEVTRAGEAAH